MNQGNSNTLFSQDNEVEKRNDEVEKKKMIKWGHSWMLKKVGNGFYSCSGKWKDSPQVLSQCWKQEFSSCGGFLFSKFLWNFFLLSWKRDFWEHLVITRCSRLLSSIQYIFTQHDEIAFTQFLEKKTCGSTSVSLGRMSSPDVQDYCHPKAPYADKSIQVVAEEKGNLLWNK